MMKKVLAPALLLAAALLPLLLPAAPPPKYRPPAATGDDAPELQTVRWLRGNGFKLADLKEKKPVVLFFLTATEKGSEGFAQFAELAVAPEHQQFEFAAIGIDRPEALETFLKANKNKLPFAADDEIKTATRYLRRNDRLPFAAVIDKSGRILWRGSPEHLPALLPEIANGKFDLKTSIEREKFSDSVTAALRIKDYPTALQLLDAELLKQPDNAELYAFKINLLGGPLQRPDECVATFDAALKILPKNIGIYQTSIGIFRKAKMDAALVRLYDRFADDFADNPALLLLIARQEMEQVIDQIKLASVYKLTSAAYRAGKFRDNVEKGAAATEYARALYYCGRPDLAVPVAKEAMTLLKDTSGAEQAKLNLIFFNNVLLLSKQIK